MVLFSFHLNTFEWNIMYKTRIVLRFRSESLEELETTIQFTQEHKTQIVLKERSGIFRALCWLFYDYTSNTHKPPSLSKWSHPFSWNHAVDCEEKRQSKTYLAVSLGAKLFSGSEKCNVEMENMITWYIEWWYYKSQFTKVYLTPKYLETKNFKQHLYCLIYQAYKELFFLLSVSVLYKISVYPYRSDISTILKNEIIESVYLLYNWNISKSIHYSWLMFQNLWPRLHFG